MLVHGGEGDRVTGARVLDLFAGTGALGLEALSRGAAFATFVDNGTVARRLISRNVERAGLEQLTSVEARDATRLGPCRRQEFDLVFVDPPYGSGLAGPALDSASSGDWLREGALVVIESNSPPSLPDSLAVETERRHGNSWIGLARFQANSP